MIFTLESMNQPVKIKLKQSNKIYSGILHAFEPTNFNIVVRNFVGPDDKAEYKVISFPEL